MRLKPTIVGLLSIIVLTLFTITGAYAAVAEVQTVAPVPASDSSNATVTATVTTGGSVTAGDVVYCGLYGIDDTTFATGMLTTPPSGWTLVEHATNFFDYYIYRKVESSSGAVTCSGVFTKSASGDQFFYSASITEYSGENQSSPEGAINDITGTDNTSPGTPNLETGAAVTPVNTGDMVVSMWEMGDNTSDTGTAGFSSPLYTLTWQSAANTDLDAQALMIEASAPATSQTPTIKYANTLGPGINWAEISFVIAAAPSGGGPVTFVSSGVGTVTSVTGSSTWTKVSGTAGTAASAGNLLICQGEINNGSDSAATLNSSPSGSGWTQIGTQQSPFTGAYWSVWWKIAAGGETTCTVGGNQTSGDTDYVSASLIIYAGENQTTPIEGTPAWTTPFKTTTGTLTMATVTPANTGDAVAAFYNTNDRNTSGVFSSPTAGYTQAWDIEAGGSSGLTMGAQYLLNASGAQTPTIVFTTSGNTGAPNANGISFVIAGATSPSGPTTTMYPWGWRGG